MTATGVTFQVINVAASGAETDGTVLPAIFSKDIGTGTQAVKIMEPIPGRRAYYYPKGDEVPKLKLNCRLYGSGFTDRSDSATAWLTPDKTTGVFANTLLKVTASEYIELPVGSYWWVDSKNGKRSGGYYNIFDMELSLSRSFYTIKDVERSV